MAKLPSFNITSIIACYSLNLDEDKTPIPPPKQILVYSVFFSSSDPNRTFEKYVLFINVRIIALVFLLNFSNSYLPIINIAKEISLHLRKSLTFLF